MTAKLRPPPWPAWIVLPLIGLLSAGLTWVAGRRGLFALDQSILFDGGHRVLCGQVPFRDFVTPVGPVSLWLQGAFFALFGVGWRGYLLSAALLDAVAVAVAFLVVRRLFPGEIWAPLVAAAGTGVWFLPPSGTPWIDSVAFLLSLLALLAMLRVWGGHDEGRRSGQPWRGRKGAAAMAGALSVATFLTKQNAGLVTLLLLAVPTAIAGIETRQVERRRSGDGSARLSREIVVGVGALALGAGITAAGFLLWLALVADPELFLRHVLRLPAATGWERLGEQPGRALLTALTGAGPRPVRGLLLLAVVPALAVFFSARRQRLFPAAMMTVGLFGAQNLFLATANNQPEISLPFAGLLVALGGRLSWGLACSAGEAPSRVGERLAVVAGAVGLVLLVATGAHTALSRRVHDVFPPGTRFSRPLAVAGLEPLRWGEPTRLRAGGDEADGPGGHRKTVDVRAAHLEGLVDRLRQDGRPFFVFPDWTLLYGVVGVPSPQPLLWFHPGLTYPRGGDPGLDRWIVRELERHGVATVVLEEVSWLGTEPRLDDFPLLRTWIQRCFVERDRWGLFRWLERRPECDSPRSREHHEGRPSESTKEDGTSAFFLPLSAK